MPITDDTDMIFFHGQLRNRWWMAIPMKDKTRIVACSASDYEQASNSTGARYLVPLLHEIKQMNIDPYRSDPLVKEYIQYLSIERGLSDNTRDAYLEDLAKLLSYLKDAHISPLEAKLKHLQDFVIDLSDVGVCMRSVARIVSGVKAFYRFLLITDKLQIDPTELLDAPR